MTTKIRRYNERNLAANLQDPIIINDTTISGGDADVTGNTSIQLAGYRALGYEKYQNEAFVWLLESFASDVPPVKAVKGQLWYKTDEQVIYAYDGADFLDGGDSTNMANWVKPVDIDLSDLTAHITDYNNPHNTTKAQVGLGDVVNGLQLLAVNNLSDLPDKAVSRDNLGVYSKAYVDANFIASGGGDTLGGLTASQFVRSDVNDDVVGTLTYFSNKSIITKYDSGTPLTYKTTSVGDLGDVKIGFNKGNYVHAITSGINFNEESTNVDKTNMFRLYKKSGTGWNTTASLIGFVTESTDIDAGGVFIGADGYSAANNDALLFPKMLHVGINKLNWGSDLVVTDAGFITRGVIEPYDDGSIDGTTGIDLGSSLKHYRTTYSRNIESTYIKSDVTETDAMGGEPQIAFRTNNTSESELQFATKDAFKIFLGEATLPLASETVSGIAKIATQVMVNAGSDDTSIVTPLKLKDYGTVRKETLTPVRYYGKSGDGFSTYSDVGDGAPSGGAPAHGDLKRNTATNRLWAYNGSWVDAGLAPAPPEYTDATVKTITFTHAAGTLPLGVHLSLVRDTALFTSGGPINYVSGDVIPIPPNMIDTDAGTAVYGHSTKLTSTTVVLSIDGNHGIAIHDWNGDNGGPIRNHDWVVHCTIIY